MSTEFLKEVAAWPLDNRFWGEFWPIVWDKKVILGLRNKILFSSVGKFLWRDMLVFLLRLLWQILVLSICIHSVPPCYYCLTAAHNDSLPFTNTFFPLDLIYFFVFLSVIMSWGSWSCETSSLLPLYPLPPPPPLTVLPTPLGRVRYDSDVK